MNEAELYARIIAGWHAARGLAEWKRLFRLGSKEGLANYQRALQRFQGSDFSDPAVQLALAREQISGAMEWAFGTPVTEELPGSESAPVNLGELARRLRALVSEAPQPDGRVVIRYANRENLLARAKAIYAPVTGPEAQGAGGTSFLLSCSLERAAGDGEIALLSPEILGAVPVPSGRENDLLGQLTDGLEILDVTGSS